LARGVWMGSYEPGRCGERVVWMGAVIVSVVDLMGEKGRAGNPEIFELDAHRSALARFRVRKRRTPVGTGMKTRPQAVALVRDKGTAIH
jgi:hypothetical protein